LKEKKKLKSDSSQLEFRQIIFLPRSFWFLLVIILQIYATIYPFMSFGESLFTDKYGMSEEVSGAIISVLPLIALFMSPPLGYIFDRFGKRLFAVNIGNGLIVIGFALLAFTYITPVFPVVLIGIFYSMLPSALWPSLAIVVKPELFSTAYGLALSLGNLMLAIFDQVEGILVDLYFYQIPLIVLLCVTICGFFVGISWNIYEHKTESLLNDPEIGNDKVSLNE